MPNVSLCVSQNYWLFNSGLLKVLFPCSPGYIDCNYITYFLLNKPITREDIGNEDVKKKKEKKIL